MLKTAVFGTQELRSVQNMADQLKVSTGNYQTYEDYCSLLVASATSYDDIHTPKSFQTNKNNNGNRRVHEHEVTDYDNYSWGGYNEEE